MGGCSHSKDLDEREDIRKNKKKPGTILNPIEPRRNGSDNNLLDGDVKTDSQLYNTIPHHESTHYEHNPSMAFDDNDM